MDVSGVHDVLVFLHVAEKITLYADEVKELMHKTFCRVEEKKKRIWPFQGICSSAAVFQIWECFY